MGLGFPCLGPSNQDLTGTKDNLQRAAPQNVFVSPFFKEEKERAKCAEFYVPWFEYSLCQSFFW